MAHLQVKQLNRCKQICFCFYCAAHAVAQALNGKQWNGATLWAICYWCALAQFTLAAHAMAVATKAHKQMPALPVFGAQFDSLTTCQRQKPYFYRGNWYLTTGNPACTIQA